MYMSSLFLFLGSYESRIDLAANVSVLFDFIFCVIVLFFQLFVLDKESKLLYQYIICDVNILICSQ